jgi:hypothetical protein
MARKLLFVASAVVVFALVGGVAFGSGPSDIVNAETIQANARVKGVKAVDERPSDEESAGDQVLFRLQLKRGGSRIGWLVADCTATFPSTLQQCTATAKIQGRGQITGQGAFGDQQQTNRVAYAVTGGTAEFRNVRGTFTVEDSGPETATVTFHLIP